MKSETNGSANCVVIHEFIRQASSAADATGTVGCAVITEFVEVGFAVGEPGAAPAPEARHDCAKTETSHPSAIPPAE